MVLVHHKREVLQVWMNRYEEALAAGLEEDEAREFAESTTDVGVLRDLVRRGCPPHLLARLVLE